MISRRSFLALLAIGPALDLSKTSTPVEPISSLLFEAPKLVVPLVRATEYLLQVRATGVGMLRSYDSNGALFIQCAAWSSPVIDFSNWCYPALDGLVFDADPGVVVTVLSIDPLRNMVNNQVLFSHEKT